MNRITSTPAIIATIGQDTSTEGPMRSLVDAGASILRFNWGPSLGIEEQASRLRRARKVAQSYEPGRVALMVDIPLPNAKVRIGMLPLRSHEIKAGTNLTFRQGTHTQDILDFIPIEASSLTSGMKLSDVVTIGDGELAFEVRQIIDANAFIGQALNDGKLPCTKSLNMGSVISALPNEDSWKEEFSVLREVQPEWIALSLVRNIEEVNMIRAWFEHNGLDSEHTHLVGKIETVEAIHNLDSICKGCDAVLVARGDLALNAPYALLGIYQKKIIGSALRHNKPVFVATQIFESSCGSFVPKRAEILDVTNIILDGASGIMLAKETSSLPRPCSTIETIRSIWKQVVTEVSEVKA